MTRERVEQTDEQQFVEAIAGCLATGSWASIIKDGERKRGFSPLSPGDSPWFPSEDWNPKDTVSLDGKRVRIVAIIARNEGTGAFSRMITGIAKADLIPIVIEPMLSMPFILRAWGWNKRMAGHDFDTREEQWLPNRKWLDARKARSP